MIENRQKITASQQKDLLPRLKHDPSVLVGKQIKHKCREEDERIVQWFDATVL
jgi:hypothetical protein